MSWLQRGIQSAIFHYVSCAPCTGYMYRKKRQRDAKRDKRRKEKGLLGEYPYPSPTSINPYQSEEITIGAGPPLKGPRRSKQSYQLNTPSRSSHRVMHLVTTHSTVGSHPRSSVDVQQNDKGFHLSDDTLDDENQNRRRFQREDEFLQGISNSLNDKSPEGTVTRGLITVKGSSLRVGGIARPSTSKSSTEYYTASRPPSNLYAPPMFTLPLSRPADNQWMLQPPPKAGVMSGKERSSRSRSGSGTSSRVELGLYRHMSARSSRRRLERVATPELPDLPRTNSYANLIASQRHDRPKTLLTRPQSATSSWRRTQRRQDTLLGRSNVTDSSRDSCETVVHNKTGARTNMSDPINDSDAIPMQALQRAKSATPPSATELSMGFTAAQGSPRGSPATSLQVVRIRSSIPRLSTVML